MFEAGAYRKISAGDDRAAQDWVEGGFKPPSALIGWLVVAGVLSIDQVRRFRAIWAATAAKQRRRSGWGRP
jgi:hypothetical protein